MMFPRPVKSTAGEFLCYLLDSGGGVTLRCRLHQLTKHRVFTGPGFQVAAELGEAANGGQVLLSQDAWLRLQDRMHEASFPVVEQLGSYKLNAWPVPLPVYQACLPSLPTTDMHHC